MAEITKNDDMIDLRDVIARFETLESELQNLRDDLDESSGVTAVATARRNLENWLNGEEGQEFDSLTLLIDDCEGNGGDEQWRGNWYPVGLIRCTYFKEYAQDLAEDCGMIQDNAKWPYTCIDWDKAARELLMNYTTVSFNGIDYHCR